MICHRCSSIVIVVHVFVNWFSFLFIDVHQFSLICNDVHKFALIFIDFTGAWKVAWKVQRIVATCGNLRRPEAGYMYGTGVLPLLETLLDFTASGVWSLEEARGARFYWPWSLADCILEAWSPGDLE